MTLFIINSSLALQDLSPPLVPSHLPYHNCFWPHRSFQSPDPSYSSVYSFFPPILYASGPLVHQFKHSRPSGQMLPPFKSSATCTHRVSIQHHLLHYCKESFYPPIKFLFIFQTNSNVTSCKKLFQNPLLESTIFTSMLSQPCAHNTMKA